VQVETLRIPKCQLDFPDRRTLAELPRAEGDAGIQQGVRLVWPSRNDDPQFADRLDGPIEVVGLEPLAVRVTDEHEELDGVDAVGPNETSLTTDDVEL
jgi:hypothetical protein